MGAGERRETAGALLGHQHRGAAVGQGLPQAFLRVFRVQGDIGAPRLEDAEHAHHQVPRAVAAEPHEDLGAHAETAEPTRQPVGAPLQLAIGQLTAVPGHGQSAGDLPGPAGEPLIFATQPLVWSFRTQPSNPDLLEGVLTSGDGSPAPAPLLHLEGLPFPWK